MRRLRHARPSPALVVAVLALIAAVAGSAIAKIATTPRLNNKEQQQVKKIARKQINKLAPGLSVANAENAENATNAADAVTLGGAVPSSYRARYAIVAADGTLVQGVAVENVERISAGQYFVRFDQSVADHAIAATTIDDDAQIRFRFCTTGQPLGIVCGGTGNNNVRTIFVNTEDEAGTNDDKPFSLTVSPANPPDA